MDGGGESQLVQEAAREMGARGGWSQHTYLDVRVGLLERMGRELTALVDQVVQRLAPVLAGLGRLLLCLGEGALDVLQGVGAELLALADQALTLGGGRVGGARAGALDLRRSVGSLRGQVVVVGHAG